MCYFCYGGIRFDNLTVNLQPLSIPLGSFIYCSTRTDLSSLLLTPVQLYATKIITNVCLKWCIITCRTYNDVGQF